MSKLIAGVDEAGRGPLAGPVTAAAVILSPDQPITGLDDSKKLSEKKRLALAEQIRRHALAWSVVHVEPGEIDSLNILWATMTAMRRAVLALQAQPDEVLIDGNRVPEGLPCDGRAIIGGDALEVCISAASILAKTERDLRMLSLHADYPEYGFAGHKGYPTAAHLAALQRLGPTPSHRMSFAPVRSAAGAGQSALAFD